ncbi:MAG: GNAT family N-acetyltransferase [Acidobacteriota bacterium]|nr:GNAT family N-acetyltransferase [Acidobacteriota bacterium]
MLRLEVVEEFGRLGELRSEWSSFNPDVLSLTPFQTPEWLFTWWKHFGSGQLRVFVFRDGSGKFVGVVPCFLHKWEERRQLTLLGSGISDYLEPPIALEHRRGAMDCLREYLVGDSGWDVCNWQDLANDSFLENIGPKAELILEHRPDLPCSEILVDRCFSEFWAGRPAGLRRNVRRYSDKARQIAMPEFRVSPSYDEECLESLIRLHSARWREQGELGTIAANGSATFLRDVTKEFARQNSLLFFSLRLEGEIAAVILSFPYRNVLFSYLSAFDPEYSALGLGRILLYEAVRYTFEQNYSAWNFLRGSEPYKFDWGAREIPKSRLLITRGPQHAR